MSLLQSHSGLYQKGAFGIARKSNTLMNVLRIPITHVMSLNISSIVQTYLGTGALEIGPLALMLANFLLYSFESR